MDQLNQAERPAIPRRLLLALSLVGASACSIEGVVEGADVEPTELIDVGLDVRRDLDLLVVVDDSGSMMQEQEALARAWPSFIQSLAGDGELPDLHVGVISSNVGTGPDGGGGTKCAGQGDDGRLLVPGGCTLEDQAVFIRDHFDPSTGRRTFNHAGDLSAQFSCMTALGIDGCGFEQHLEAIRRAVDDQEHNAGFLRPEAQLGVIILADEDDCSAADPRLFDPTQDDVSLPLGELSSFRCFEFGVRCDGEVERELGPRAGCVPDEASAYMEDVATYVDHLVELKGGAHKLVVATITGDLEPVEVGIDPLLNELWLRPSCVVCPDGTSEGCPIAPTADGAALVAAAPAFRLRAFADAFGMAAISDSICSFDAQSAQVDFALDDIAQLMRDRSATRCVAAELPDTDPERDGIQPLCEVAEVAGDAELAVASCDDSEPPCWRLVDAPECPQDLALVVDRAAAEPAGGTISMRCAGG